jgi:hypothetical protein
MDQGHLACQIGSRGMALRIIGIDHGSKEQLVKDCGAEVFIDSAYSCFILGHPAPVSGAARTVHKDDSRLLNQPW